MIKTMTRVFASIFFLLIATAATASTTEPYPDRPIRIVVPFTPGGWSDALARVLSAKLAERLGQAVVVLNRPGAGGMIASDFVSRSDADGYTLFFPNASTLLISPQLRAEAAPDPLQQFDPVINFAKFSLVMTVGPTVQQTDLKEFVQYAKRNPGKVSYASAGIGTTPHMVGALMEKETGVEMLHVAYSGAAPAVTALLAGQVDAFFEPVSTVGPLIEAGRLKALAVTGRTRVASLPNVPTVIEAGFPSLVTESWTAVVAPKGTPRAVLERLNKEIDEILQLPDVRDAVETRGFSTVGGSAEELASLIRSEGKVWKSVIKEKNIKSN